MAGVVLPDLVLSHRVRKGFEYRRLHAAKSHISLCLGKGQIPRSTYALITTSTRIAVVGMRNRPSQNEGVEKSISAIPTKTAPTGIVGQMLL